MKFNAFVGGRLRRRSRYAGAVSCRMFFALSTVKRKIRARDWLVSSAEAGVQRLLVVQESHDVDAKSSRG